MRVQYHKPLSIPRECPVCRWRSRKLALGTGLCPGLLHQVSMARDRSPALMCELGSDRVQGKPGRPGRRRAVAAKRRFPGAGRAGCLIPVMALGAGPWSSGVRRPAPAAPPVSRRGPVQGHRPGAACGTAPPAGRAAPRPLPRRASQRAMVALASPSRRAMATVVMRVLWRKSRSSAMRASSKRPGRCKGALAPLQSAARPPCRKRRNPLQTMRTGTPNASVIRAADRPAEWPAAICARPCRVRHAP